MTQRAKKLLVQVRHAIRLKHYAYSTEQTCRAGAGMSLRHETNYKARVIADVRGRSAVGCMQCWAAPIF